MTPYSCQTTSVNDIKVELYQGTTRLDYIWYYDWMGSWSLNRLGAKAGNYTVKVTAKFASYSVKDYALRVYSSARAVTITDKNGASNQVVNWKTIPTLAAEVESSLF